MNERIQEDNLSGISLDDTAKDLYTEIMNFDTAVLLSYENLESSDLANYLLRLAKVTGRAMNPKHGLRVKGEVESKAIPRLMLLSAAKKTLGDGMQMLGLRPIERL